MDMNTDTRLTTCISHYPTAAAEDALALTGGLTEIRTRQPGPRALALVLPALARLSQERRWLAWIAPPDIPAGPLLASAGVDLSRVLVVHPRACADGLRAVERALRAGTCGAVLAWLTRADEETLHRLRSAAEDGHSWGVMFHAV